GILTVPERQRKAEPLSIIADPAEPVLAPAVRAAACVVVGERFPRGTVRGAVLAHGSPLSFTQVWTPLFPRGLRAPCRVESLSLCTHCRASSFECSGMGVASATPRAGTSTLLRAGSVACCWASHAARLS